MRVGRRRFARALRPADTPRRPPRPHHPAVIRLRHPFRGTRLYPRPKAPRPARSHEPRGPRMRPRKSMADRVKPSEPSPPRTVVRLRVLGLVVLVLFSLMFVRLWYLQVLNTQSYTRAVVQNQVRPVEVPAARGLILDRTANIMVGDKVTQDITLSRLSAQQHPSVIGQLAALLGISSAQIQSDLANVQYSLYKPVPILENAPLSDVLYIGEHATMFPGVSTVADTNRTYPMGQTGVQMLGYVGQISSQELQAHQSQGYELGDLYGQSGLEAQYEPALRGHPGIDRVDTTMPSPEFASVHSPAPPCPRRNAGIATSKAKRSALFIRTISREACANRPETRGSGYLPAMAAGAGGGVGGMAGACFAGEIFAGRFFAGFLLVRTFFALDPRPFTRPNAFLMF